MGPRENVWCLIVILSFIEKVNLTEKNNVCRNVEGYSNKMESNPSCWYNEDIDSSPEKLAKRYGFLLERHNITTQDGYISTIFKLYQNSTNLKKSPVYLQHGLGSNGLVFMKNENRSIAFFLARKFIVWIGNVRGSSFSRRLNNSEEEYWKFSYHEMGLYDIPSSLEYVYANSNRKKIIYIGHSMGGTMAAIYGSQYPEHAKKYVEKMIFLCSPIIMRHSKGLLSRTVIKNTLPLIHILRTSGIYSILDEGSTERNILFSVFYSSTRNTNLVIRAFNIIMGPMTELSPDMLTAALSVFKGVSVKTFEHYCQFVLSGMFQHFDYGQEVNLKIYNSSTAPVYDLSKIRVPVDIVYCENDYWTQKEDAELVFNSIGSSVKTITGIKRYNHIDLLFESRNNSKILPILNKLVGNEITLPTSILKKY